MIIDPEQWISLGGLIGAIALPVFLYATNKGGSKMTTKETFMAVVYGFFGGGLAAILLVGLCGFFGVKMK
jgi:hypothetical protein